MITVWGRASSSNVQATLWCLAELGLEFDRIDAGFIYGVTDTPAYLEMNPNGFVPTLVDGETCPCSRPGPFFAIWRRPMVTIFSGRWI